MKKLISIFVIVVLCMALACPVFATGEAYTPSVGYKPAPPLAVTETEDGDVVGYVYDDEGNTIGSITVGDDYLVAEIVHEEAVEEGHECIVIVPLSEVEVSEDMTEEAKETTLWVFEQIKELGMDFFADCEGLDEYVAAGLGEGKTAADLVVKDLFYVSVLCDEMNEYLEPSGTTICLDFDMGLEPDSFVAVVAYKGGQWRMIEEVEVGVKGNVVCTTFENFCPVAVLMEATDLSEDVAASADVQGTDGTDVAGGTNLVLWGGLLGGALLVLIILLLVLRKKKAAAKV